MLEGRVLDHVGNGVEGVEIAGGAASFARTDAEGRFRVQTAPMVELWVLPPHRPPMRYLRALKANRVRATAEIRLEPGGQVVGRVVDAAGRIVPDADLLLFPVASGLLSGPLVRSITGEDGRFAATLDHRKWVLMVEEPGFAPVTVEGLHPLPGETRDLGDLTLVEGANLAGKVLDPEGRPVAGARVDLRPVFGNVPTRHYLRHNPYRTKTTTQGASPSPISARASPGSSRPGTRRSNRGV